MPKGTDLTLFSQYRLNAIAKEINDRPRRCLEYDTPLEVLTKDIFNLRK
jgi:IS30 family transposase